MYRVANNVMGRTFRRLLPESNGARGFGGTFSCILLRQYWENPPLAELLRRPSTVVANRQQSRTLHSVSIHIDDIHRYHPALASIINLSLESATVSSDMKHALVTPLLKKKTCQDANDIKNYRPISNLSFVSKLLERQRLTSGATSTETNFSTHSRVHIAPITASKLRMSVFTTTSSRRLIVEMK